MKRTVTILRILYPLWMICGIFSIMYVPGKLVVAGNGAATAANILANPFLFRSGIVGSLITQLLFIIAALLLYKLFESVNKDQSLLMIVLALVSVPIAMLNTLNQLAALLTLKNAEQMMFFLDLNAQGITIPTIFWGLWLFPLGYLIIQSGYFPKMIGFIVMIGGVGYCLDAFTKLLIPDLTMLLSFFQLMAMGEVIFLAWLVIVGPKLPKA